MPGLGNVLAEGTEGSIVLRATWTPEAKAEMFDQHVHIAWQATCKVRGTLADKTVEAAFWPMHRLRLHEYIISLRSI